VAEPDPPSPAEHAGEHAGEHTADAVATHRRTVLFTAVGAVVAAALIFAVVARVASTDATTAAGGGKGGGGRAGQFDIGRAKDFSPTIDRSGPLLFPDPQGHSRDIFVQHLGGTDWVAFEARATGAPRQCVLKWEQDAKRFVDPCDGRVYPADGAGLVTFPTVVSDKGRVIVDLSSPIAPTTTTTTTPAAEPY
jgi:hypothetical protein